MNIDDILRAHGYGSGIGTAGVGDVLASKTFTSNSGLHTGTMPNNGSLGTITPTTSSQAIPSGYTTGGTVAGDANLVAANILSGKSIFGVAGTIPPSASGNVTSDSNGYITVTGLTFTPKIIIVRDTTYSGLDTPGWNIYTSQLDTAKFLAADNTTNAYIYHFTDTLGGQTGRIYVNSSGFCLWVAIAAASCNWWAYA